MQRLPTLLLLLLCFAMGCGETWARPGVEVPLHRDLMGLTPKDPPCTLKKPDWEKFCTPENFNNEKLCPKGCPMAAPNTNDREQ
jgi:hypothetical protein